MVYIIVWRYKSDVFLTIASLNSCSESGVAVVVVDAQPCSVYIGFNLLLQVFWSSRSLLASCITLAALLWSVVAPGAGVASFLLRTACSILVKRFWLILCKKLSIAGKSKIPCLTPVIVVSKFPGVILWEMSVIMYGPLNIGTCCKLKYIVGCNNALPKHCIVQV